jgi:UTP--glucose-1-phosphate uridylyltransferase
MGKWRSLGPAVITAAGLGTRLFPLTKEIPKEMLPIFFLGKNNRISAKPILQVIFDQLFEFGFDSFHFIINGRKDIIRRHFTADRKLLDLLLEKNRIEALDITSFYKRLDLSSINYVNQPKPLGFGDAVLKTKPYINEPFLVQAGDNYFHSYGNLHLLNLISTFYLNNSMATFMVTEVDDPRNFGVVEAVEIDRDVYRVKNVFEKPNSPVSNLAIAGLYYFHPVIFDALERINHDANGELQLTDGIQKLIDLGYNVTAVKLDKSDYWLDVGNLDAYWNTLMVTRAHLHEYEKKINSWGENLLQVL